MGFQSISSGVRQDLTPAAQPAVGLDRVIPSEPPHVPASGRGEAQVPPYRKQDQLGQDIRSDAERGFACRLAALGGDLGQPLPHSPAGLSRLGAGLGVDVTLVGEMCVGAAGESAGAKPARRLRLQALHGQLFLRPVRDTVVRGARPSA